MRLFLDANVLFTAAHRPEGKASLLFLADLQGLWTLLGSHYVIEEAERNLSRKYPRCLGELENLVSRLTIVEAPRSPPALSLPLRDKDAPVWATALASRSSHLLTGDLRDFGPFMNQPAVTGGIVIQTVDEFLLSLDRAPAID